MKANESVRPVARFGGTGRRAVSGWEALVRMLAMLVAVVAPFPVVAAVVVAVCGRALPLRGRWWLAAGGGLALVVVALFGAWAAYTVPYGEAVGALARQDAQTLLQAGPEGLVLGAVGRLPGWLLVQAPLAVAAGTLAGGLWLVWRWRYRARWREQRVELTEARLDALVARLGERDGREPARELTELRVRLGVDTETGVVCEVPGPALRQHVFVAGATGYGKSRSIERLVHELVAAEHARPLRIPVVFIDMKADPEFAGALESMARSAGRRFRLVTVTGEGGSYNPIRRGSVEQVCSRIVETLDQVAGGGFSEPHHREAAEVFLRYAMRALDDLVDQHVVEAFADGRRAWKRDLPDLARLMSVKALTDRVQLLGGATGRDVHAYLEYLQTDGRDLKRSVPGLAARITNMVAGEAGRVLTDRPGGIDLYDAIQAGDIVLFSLSAARDARAARQIGSLALTDLGAVGDRLLAERWATGGGFFFAGVDEFSALGGSTMTSLFQRIRGAGGGLLLATQDLADLDAVSREFAAAVMTNTNLMLLHRQRSAAEPIAALLGTRPGWEEVLQVQDDTGLLGTASGTTGASQIRPIEERIVEPETLRRLAPGHAVVAVGHPLDTTRTVRVALAPRTVAVPAPSGPVELTKTLAPALRTEPQPAPPTPPTQAHASPPRSAASAARGSAGPPQGASGKEPVEPAARAAGKPAADAVPGVDGADMWA